MNAAEQRKAHAAKLSRAWWASPKGQAYELIRRKRLLNPDWMVADAPRVWKFSEDLQLLRRARPDVELAIKFQLTKGAVRQRRHRLNSLIWAAGQHARISSDQIRYSLRLQKALAK